MKRNIKIALVSMLAYLLAAPFNISAYQVLSQQSIEYQSQAGSAALATVIVSSPKNTNSIVLPPYGASFKVSGLCSQPAAGALTIQNLLAEPASCVSLTLSKTQTAQQKVVVVDRLPAASSVVVVIRSHESLSNNSFDSLPQPAGRPVFPPSATFIFVSAFILYKFSLKAEAKIKQKLAVVKLPFLKLEIMRC